MTVQEIKNLVLLLGFMPESTEEKVFVKKFSNNNDYALKVDFQNKKIIYGTKIKVNDETTANFANPENFVVLECVNRLLEKGYEPQHIELERKWTLGRTAKGGKADITVYDRTDNSLIIIECKTFGSEFEKEKKRLFDNGGQLFSYRQQDRSTRFLCLYASQLFDKTVRYENLIVQIEDRPEVLELLKINPDELAYQTANDAKKLHEVWKEQYSSFTSPNGIFDDDVNAYEPQKVPIKRKDLKPFDEDEGRKFFNEFAEILRHNNISDQSNAFNRILSLVLCKIVDEQKKPDEITDFQIKDVKEPAEAIQDRLQKLYAEGMKRFLKEEIVYFSEDEINKVILDFPEQFAKDKIREMFREQKFYSNNEFAFKEVHNQKLFNENARVLNEILQLLQYKQFRYERKDSAEYKKQKSYLGDFFELLLDAGYKQTSGQFFTPLPIAKFIVSSLPIRETISRKLAKKDKDFLPFVIDYACGSGHFLIEAIDEIQDCVDELKPDYSNEINLQIKHWQEKDWTKGFIYGIERDYRLARTAKIACFMNGDGEADIIFGDGLEDYRNTEHNFPETFDILVANPPYSIHGFKPHTKQGIKRNKFSLMDLLTDTASEIEVLFIERLSQLLHTNGVCGIILPSSILSNAGIYTKAREILLKNFEIRAIVEFGSNTFMATGTNTVTLFLKKRAEKVSINAEYVANDFILHNKKRKADFADTETIFAEYTQTIGFALEDYKTFLSQKPNVNITDSDWYKDYRRYFEDLTVTKNLRKDAKFKKKSEKERTAIIEERFYAEILAKEKDKFEFFFLVYGQKTLIVRAYSDGKDEKRFLGYEFSKRRGDEGIKLYRKNGKHETTLYDETDLDNPEKLNYAVRQTLLADLFDYRTERLEALPDLPEILGEQAKIVDLSDCFDFSRIEFEKQINLSANTKNRTPIASKYEQIPFTQFATLEYGSPLKEENRIEGKYPVVGSNGIVGYHNEFLIEKPAIIVGRKGSMGKVNWINEDCFPIDTTFYVNFDNKKVLPKYLYYLLLEAKPENYGGGVGVPGLNRNEIHRLKFPLPNKNIQKEIVKEIEAIETKEEADRIAISKQRKNISDKADSFFVNFPLVKLGNVCESPEYGAAEKAKRGNPASDFRYIRITDVNENGKLSDKEFMTAENIEEKYILTEGDFLFARSGNTVGKTFLYSETFGKAIYAGYFIRFKTNSKVLLSKFLNVLTKSENYKNWVSSTQGGSSQPNINAAQYSNFEIPLPSIKEQEKIVAEIEVLEKEITVAEERLSKTADLKAEVLRKYL